MPGTSACSATTRNASANCCRASACPIPTGATWPPRWPSSAAPCCSRHRVDAPPAAAPRPGRPPLAKSLAPTGAKQSQLRALGNPADLPPTCRKRATGARAALREVVVAYLQARYSGISDELTTLRGALRAPALTENDLKHALVTLLLAACACLPTPPRRGQLRQRPGGHRVCAATSNSTASS